MTRPPVVNIKWLVVLLVFTATVFTLTHVPQQVLPEVVCMNGLDRVFHTLAYGTVAILSVLSFRVSHNSMLGLIVLLAILALAAADEMTQSYVGRTTSLYDWMADVTGVAIARSIFLFRCRPKPKVSLNRSFLSALEEEAFHYSTKEPGGLARKDQEVRAERG